MTLDECRHAAQAWAADHAVTLTEERREGSGHLMVVLHRGPALAATWVGERAWLHAWRAVTGRGETLLQHVRDLERLLGVDGEAGS